MLATVIVSSGSAVLPSGLNGFKNAVELKRDKCEDENNCLSFTVVAIVVLFLLLFLLLLLLLLFFFFFFYDHDDDDNNNDVDGDDVSEEKVQKVCRCSDNRGLSVLLDSRLIIVVVVWTTVLSIIILIIFVVIAVDRPQPRLVRLRSDPDLRHTGPESESTRYYGENPTSRDAPVVRQQSSVSEEEWIQSLRDENWILYPTSATVVSHRRINSDAEERRQHDLLRETNL